jgi:hypothetical protein
MLNGEPWLDENDQPVKGILRLRQIEADALAQAHRDILDRTATTYGIAQRWNKVGILTSQGKEWTAREVSRVLLRPRNASLVERRGQIIGKSIAPGVVDETTWRAVTAILRDPKRNISPGPARKHLLSHLAHCGACDGPLKCTGVTEDHAKRTVYRCKTRGHVQRDAAELEKFIVKLLIGRLSKPDARKLLKRDNRGELTRLYREAQATEELMTADRRMQQEGLLTVAEFAEGRRKYQADLVRIRQQITEAEQADVLAPLIHGDPARVWEGYELDRKRAVIDALMTITVKPIRGGRPSGWRPGASYFDPRSVVIEWKRDAT